MNAPAPRKTAIRAKDFSAALGISKGHGSEVLRGKTAPSLSLALLIYSTFGLKLGPIARATARQIAALQSVSRQGAGS